MNRVMVQPNPTKEIALQVSRRLISMLLAEAFQVVALEEYREVLIVGLSEEEIGRIRFLREPDIYNACDFIMVVGGDGTILRIAGQASLYEKPVLGVNCGTVGFMSELEPDELELVKSVKDGNFTLDDRSMLDIQVFNSINEEVYSTVALNEAVVTKGFFNRVIPLSVIVDGQEVFQFSGDGVIVTTPTGSTAYSLSSGGPIVLPESKVLIITPIAPHNLNVRPLVVPDTSEISLRMNSLSLNSVGVNSYCSSGSSTIRLFFFAIATQS